MPELDDAAIELRLRSVLSARLGELRLDLDVDELERRRARRDAARRRQRILIGLGLAATLLVPVGWLVAGAPVPTTPMPADTLRTPGPSDSVASAPSGDFQAIVIRGAAGSPAGTDLDVVAVRADGQERLVTQIPAASLPAGFRFLMTTSVSSDGWLALGDLTAPRVVLVDLANPSTPIRTVPGWFEPDAIAWGPDGRIAVRAFDGPGGSSDQITVADPNTGASISVSPDGAFESEPIAWAADGSGFIATTSLVRLMTPDRPPTWQRLVLPSGAIESRFLPVFDARDRRISGAGDRLALCRPGINGMGTCRASAGFELGRQDVAGALTVWDVTPAAGGVYDAVFAANDRGIWLLSRDLTSGTVVLDRLDADGNVVMSQTAPIPPGVGPATTVDIPDSPSTASFDGMAPDDSLARIVFTYEDPDVADWMLLPTDGLPSTYHRGVFAGYLGSIVADALGGEAFSPPATASGPALSHAPKLPTAGQLDAFAAAISGVTAADNVLLRLSSDDPPWPGSASVEQAAGHRLAIQFACSGPGDINVSALNVGYSTPCLGDDQSQNGWVVDAPRFDDTVEIQFVFDPRTSWRVAVYDLGP